MGLYLKVKCKEIGPSNIYKQLQLRKLLHTSALMSSFIVKNLSLPYVCRWFIPNMFGYNILGSMELIMMPNSSKLHTAFYVGWIKEYFHMQ